MSPDDRERRNRATGEYRWLLNRLDRFRRYLKTVTLVGAAMNVVVALLVLGPALFLLDNWLHFATVGRLAAFLVLVGGVAMATQAAVRLLLETWSYERLALRIEKRFPQLENRLINAVQLGAVDAESPSYGLIQGIVNESVREARVLALREAVDLKRLKRSALLGGFLALAALAYPILLPAYFQNAAARILMPTSDIEALTRTQIEVVPGDVSVGRGESLTIAGSPSGTLPRSARLSVRGAETKSEYTMGFDGQRFEYEMAEIQDSFRYRIEAGDYRSRWYEVEALVKPRIARLRMRIEYPSYTALSPTVIDPSDGAIVALVGSKVTVTAWTNKSVARAELRMNGQGAREIEPVEESLPGVEADAAGDRGETVSRLSAEIEIRDDGAYRWFVRDAEGMDNQPAPKYVIRATEDEPPRAVITSPRGEIEVAQGDTVSVLFSASDDYGLVRVTLLEENDRRQQTLVARTLEGAQRILSDGVVVETRNYEVGKEIRLTLEATDTNPIVAGRAESDPVVLKIVEPRVEAEDLENATENFAAELLALLEAQRETRKKLALWSASIEVEHIETATRAGALKRVIWEQSEIRAEGLRLMDFQLPDDSDWLAAKGVLTELAAGAMRDAVDRLREIDLEGEAGQIEAKSEEGEELQQEIVLRLAELIETLREAFPALMELLETERALAKGTGQTPPPESLRDLYGEVLDFIDDQEGVLASLQRMEDIDPKDFSDREYRELEDLAEKEDQWAEYFKDAAEWLRKSPQVDGTESGLRDELVEMYIEIEALPQELLSAPVDIPVDEETVKNGLELAEELTHDLEKWLPEEPDYMKWMLENASEDYEVPIADLPDELEDMMGELLEMESDMYDAIEDITSNWADSIDAGAGWDAVDGPISNYSAKGVTGNLMPNDMDISGRSGEGRTGRSLGEIVESVATGKGGRDAQTRMTSDAMGAGVVEDLSTEETTGVTGGGKVAGMSGYGLVAANAPEQPMMVQQLAQGQSDLKMKALDLSKTLNEMQLPTGHLESSIRGMERLSEALESGRYNNLKDLHAVVVSDLSNQRKVVRDQMKLRRDPSSGGRRQLQHQIKQGGDEEFPDEYRSLLSAYYEALSRKDWE